MMLFTLYNIHINIHIIHTEERFIDKKYYNLCQKVIWSIGHLKGTIYVSIHYDKYTYNYINACIEDFIMKLILMKYSPLFL